MVLWGEGEGEGGGRGSGEEFVSSAADDMRRSETHQSVFLVQVNRSFAYTIS